MKLGGRIFEDLGHVFAQRPHDAATRTAIGIRRIVMHLVARQMLGKRFALRLALFLFLCRRDEGFYPCLLEALLGLEVFQREFQLIHHLVHAFRRLAELFAFQSRQLYLQLLDAERIELDGIKSALQFGFCC